MKKRNIIAILASCAAVLTIFTACGSKEDDVTNPTVVGTDGKVYEEITEAVTDTEGEAVTDAAGETQVVVVTKPYTTKKAEKEKDKDKEKDDKTKAPDENPGTTATPGTPNATTPDTTYPPLFPGLTEPAGETTTTYEDVTFPEGEIIDVELNQSGRPQQSMTEKLFKDSANNKSLYIDGSIVTNDKQVFGIGMRMKVYLKGNKFATEFPIGMTSVRFAFDGKSMNVIFPKAKAYYSAATAEETEMNMAEEMGLWKMLSTENMEYVSTARVKIQGKEYLCETYTNPEKTGSAKYYFNGKSELKRMEFIGEDGSTTIFKVESASSTVDDSVFSVPKGYDQLTEENFESMAGSLGLT